MRNAVLYGSWGGVTVGNQHYRSESGTTYRVVERLGAPGGFGSVVEVEDDDGRRFALKTLHFGIPGDVLAVEAANLQRVRHENVVGYADFGLDPEPFLVMELAPGGTLKDYLARCARRSANGLRDRRRRDHRPLRHRRR